MMRVPIRLWFILIVVLKITCLEAQNKPSYLKDSVDANFYHTKFESYLHNNIVKAKVYLDSLKMVSDKNIYSNASYLYYYDSGNYNFVTHHQKRSVEHYTKAYELAKYPVDALKAKIWLANHMYFDNELSKSEELYRDILRESKAIDFIDGIANAYFGLAILNKDNSESLKYFLKVDSVYTKAKSISPILANTYESIATIYFETYDNKEVAESYYNKALKISRATNYTYGVESVLNSLHTLLSENEDNEKKRQYLEELLQISTKKNDTIAMAHNLSKLASVEINSKNFNRAEDVLNKASTYYKTLSDSTSLIYTNLKFAELYLKKEDFLKAERYLDSIQNFKTSYVTDEVNERLLALKVEYYEFKNEFELALNTQKKLDSLKTTLLHQRNDEEFFKLERQYQTEKKEQEIALLTAKNEIFEQEKNNQRNIFIAGLAVLLLGGLFLYFQYREKQKTNRKLKEFDAAKSDFYANISHEFRTPLTLISGPLQDLLNEGNLNSDEKKQVQVALRNSKRMLELVNQLLDLSKLESNFLKLKIENQRLMPFLSMLAEGFSYKAKSKSIAYTISVDASEAYYFFDKDALEKIVVNVLSNAIKYTPEFGEVNFSAQVNNEWLSIEIFNTGSGLSKSEMNFVFDRFYQKNQTSEGVGLGLALVKQLVELHKGKIDIESSKDKFVKFSIEIPVGKKVYDASELINTNSKIEVVTAIDKGKKIIGLENAKIMLIVEDNEDIRAYIKTIFKEEYHIIEASNGEEGFTVAIEHVPDIIISDVMMPIKDGMALCKDIKQDERTSHIPLILLTAKAGDENVIQGTELGADDYITKPFDKRLLKQKVRNLLKTREELRKRFTQELVLKPMDVSVSSGDELFIARLQNVLHNKLTDPSFKSEEFSKEMGMSRMQLHRKLKALVGLSTSEFIKQERLKLATELLKKSSDSIAQIGYAVGFNDPAYFSKTFKKVYNCTPSEYAELFSK